MKGKGEHAAHSINNALFITDQRGLGTKQWAVTAANTGDGETRRKLRFGLVCCDEL